MREIMSLRHSGWNHTEDCTAAFTHTDTLDADRAHLDRPSLVDMTREQYEGLLSRALRRSHRED